MSRVNIEDSAFVVAQQISNKTGIPKPTVLGYLALLWHASQMLNRCSATVLDLAFYLEFKDERQSISVFIEALIDTGVLKKTKNKLFTIVGNNKHIDNINELRRRARNGGMARANSINYAGRHKRPLEPAASAQYSAVQYNTIHTVHSAAREDINECIKSWGTTLARYGINKDPKMDETQIARLIQTHGVDKTKLALLGAGLETRTEKYDPAKYCRITRLLKPDIFDLCVNLGAQKKENPREVFEVDIAQL